MLHQSQNHETSTLILITVHSQTEFRLFERSTSNLKDHQVQWANTRQETIKDT